MHCGLIVEGPAHEEPTAHLEHDYSRLSLRKRLSLWVERAMQKLFALIACSPSKRHRTYKAHKKRNEWEVEPEKVMLGERLAVGGFAEVFVGKYEVISQTLLQGIGPYTRLGVTASFQQLAMRKAYRMPHWLSFRYYLPSTWWLAVIMMSKGIACQAIYCPLAHAGNHCGNQGAVAIGQFHSGKVSA